MSSPGLSVKAEVSDKANRDIDDLIRAFGKLPEKVAKRYILGALRRSIKPFRSNVWAATPKRSGGLANSTKIITRFGKKVSRGSLGSFRGTAFGIVGFSRRLGGHHASIVEDGTKARFTKKGAFRGRMPPRHMLRNTLTEEKAGILANLETQLGISLDRAVKKIAREKGK